MKRDYQDDSSFSSWYPDKPAYHCKPYVQLITPPVDEITPRTNKNNNHISVSVAYCIEYRLSFLPVRAGGGRETLYQQG